MTNSIRITGMDEGYLVSFCIINGVDNVQQLHTEYVTSFALIKETVDDLLEKYRDLVEHGGML
mgnify:CR=1 FL=1